MGKETDGKIECSDKQRDNQLFHKEHLFQLDFTVMLLSVATVGAGTATFLVAFDALAFFVALTVLAAFGALDFFAGLAFFAASFLAANSAGVLYFI